MADQTYALAQDGVYGQSNGRYVDALDAIPDSGLEHHYDATEISVSDGSAISSWTDQAGSLDLAAVGDPTYDATALNENPCIITDGTDDGLAADGSLYSQPNQIFIVAQTLDNSGFSVFIDSYSKVSHEFQSDDGGGYRANAGSTVDFGSTDTNPNIYSLLFDGGNSQFRKNGNQIGSADPGTDSLGALAVGYRRSGPSNYHNARFGEILVYNRDLSASETSDIESHLSSKWGITI